VWPEINTHTHDRQDLGAELDRQEEAAFHKDSNDNFQG
jgi:hypothetical protein